MLYWRLNIYYQWVSLVAREAIFTNLHRSLARDREDMAKIQAHVSFTKQSVSFLQLFLFEKEK